MFSLFRKTDAAEDFIWTDGNFKSVTHSEKTKELKIEYIDYTETEVTFNFKGVDDLEMNDPVYCLGSDHKLLKGKKRIELNDDEDVILSFIYETVEMKITKG